MLIDAQGVQEDKSGDNQIHGYGGPPDLAYQKMCAACFGG